MYTSDQIADHFIAISEGGLLKNNLLESDKSSKISKPINKINKSEIKKQTLYDLKRKCIDLIKLIDEEEID
jgi:hypothetical protein